MKDYQPGRPADTAARATIDRQGREGQPMIFETDHNQLRVDHFRQLQQVLEEGLQEITSAPTEQEAEDARLRARARLQELNSQYQDLVHNSP